MATRGGRVRARLWLIAQLVLLAPAGHAQTPAGDTLDDDSRVVAKFDHLSEAQALAKGLRAAGQVAETRVETERVTLKTLTLGPYASSGQAQQVEADLRVNRIDAWTTRVHGETFVVHAGAIADEVFFRDRYEKLRGLGYKDITTGQTQRSVNHYVVLSWGQDPPVQAGTLRQALLDSGFKSQFAARASAWRSSQGNSTGVHLQLAAGQQKKWGDHWETALGAQADGYELSEGEAVFRLDADFLPTYLALNLKNHRILAGMDNTGWTADGERPLSGDTIQRRDLFYYQPAVPVDQNERPTNMLRWQIKEEQFQFDLIWNPVFQGARLPETGSVWHPVDPLRGKIRGLATTATLAELVKTARVAPPQSQDGGAALHISRSRGDSAQSITASYAPFSQPYFQLNPLVQQHLAQGMDAASAGAGIDDTLREVHPVSAVLAVEEHARNWQFEVAFIEKAPVTTTDYQLSNSFSTQLFALYRDEAYKNRVRWHSSVELTRLETVARILDRRTRARLGEGLEYRSSGGRWRGGIDTLIGVDLLELYLHPYLHYRSGRLANLKVEAHGYGGEDGSEFGFHHRQAIVNLVWQAIF